MARQVDNTSQSARNNTVPMQNHIPLVYHNPMSTNNSQGTSMRSHQDSNKNQFINVHDPVHFYQIDEESSPSDQFDKQGTMSVQNQQVNSSSKFTGVGVTASGSGTINGH